jgi:hypothetical protein
MPVRVGVGVVWRGVGVDSSRNSFFVDDDGKFCLQSRRHHLLHTGCFHTNSFHWLRHHSTTGIDHQDRDISLVWRGVGDSSRNSFLRY